MSGSSQDLNASQWLSQKQSHWDAGTRNSKTSMHEHQDLSTWSHSKTLLCPDYLCFIISVCLKQTGLKVKKQKKGNINWTHRIIVLIHVWTFPTFCHRFVGPCTHCILMATRWLQSLWTIVLGVIVQPFFISAGRCCGGFSIHLAKEWDCDWWRDEEETHAPPTPHPPTPTPSPTV